MGTPFLVLSFSFLVGLNPPLCQHKNGPAAKKIVAADGAETSGPAAQTACDAVDCLFFE